MSASLVRTRCRELGTDVAFPGRSNTVEPSEGPYTHLKPGLCSGTASAKYYEKMKTVFSNVHFTGIMSHKITNNIFTLLL